MVPRSSTDGLRTAFTFDETSIPVSRWALHVLLLGLSLLTTTIVGVVLAQSFQSNRALDLDQYVNVVPLLVSRPWLLLGGLPYSLTLMTILLGHELGHYFACRYYGIDASLPYFLPSPLPGIGTFGAFIRIRSPIYTRRALFDVGVAGPLAGFILLLPAMAIGLAYSRVIPGIAERGDMIFSVPAIQRLMELLIFPGRAAADISLHPVARAAWVGTLATALNLLPIGQLDGGHIVYSFTATKHKLLSRLFVAVLVPLGIFYWRAWLVWAALLFFFALRHPVIFDVTPLDRRRVALGILAATIFLLTFTVIPIH
ncbi:MAG TPA: site-2 protease family protein [Bryobacteraceae bacterium]|nr:site-2 protease family protein [Bryobacteraceae bacterium]